MQTIQLENWILTGENGERIETTVPSDIFDELYSAGITDDPLYGDNLEKIRPLFDKTWKYTAFFDLSEELIGSERAILVFDGIDTVSEITLNGKPLGRTNNMFLRYEFEVKSLIKAKGSVLEVKIFPATKYVEEKGYNYRTLFGQNRLALRKAQCQFGWDWAPICPTAFISSMTSEGVLKNIAFTNAEFTGNNGAFLFRGGSGTIKNVYVSYSNITNGGTYVGTVVSCQNGTMEGIFIDASNATVSGTGNDFKVLACNSNGYNGIFAIIPTSENGYTTPKNATDREGNNYSKVAYFETAAEMVANAETMGVVAGRDTTYWTITSGSIPQFKTKN